MPLTLILSVGLDLTLLANRARLLQSAGYSSIAALSLKDAVYRLQAEDFDLVMLCRSIPAKDRECLTCLIRASVSSIPIVSIAEASGQHDAFPDATLDDDEASLLRGLQKITSKSWKRKDAISQSTKAKASLPSRVDFA